MTISGGEGGRLDYASDDGRPLATVVVPAFNEAALIEDVLDRLDAYFLSTGKPEAFELLVVDDGSSDGTHDLLQRWSDVHPGRVNIVTHAHNAGLVAAIRTGCAAATGRTIVVMDADLSYGPATIEALLKAKRRTNAAVAIASPYMNGGHTANVPFTRLAASRLANLLLSACVGGRVKTFTGMVRAYDAEALRLVLASAEVGEFNSWVIARFLHAGATFVEVPAALVWPASRAREPSRLTLRKFLARVRLTLVTAATLLALSSSGPRRPRE